MRFGNWRGVALAFALSSAFVAVQAGPAFGGHDIPREVTAVDVNTGGPYFAPPIPYGHYAKDCMGTIHNGIGLAKGSLLGLFHKGCGLCGGKGCGACGGTGHCGLFGHGCGGDPSCGGDPACGGGWKRCHGCGGGGCGFCQGLGLFKGHGHKGLCGDGGCSGHASTVAASGQAAPAPSAQAPCSVGGCGLKFKHSHHRGLGRGCGSCGGRGCGLCGDPVMAGDPCGACGGKGCGLCGKGLFGHGGGCGACGGKGCGLCGKGLFGHGGGCGACGGKGCGLCGGGHHLLGLPHALVNKVLHRGEIKYFVGPGGPVPITPGYVPYVVTTRSPRDYFAFPPFVD